MNQVAMAQAVQKAAKPKFRGRSTLKSKVVTHYPAHLEREYIRITNSYMALLNRILAEHLPIIRKAITSERANMRHDSDADIQAIIAKTFMTVQNVFEKQSESFGLRQKLDALAKLNRKLTIREWKRVVHKTLGINIVEDYYLGEFYRHTLAEWTERNIKLIKSVPQETINQMYRLVVEGYRDGETNTNIGKAIQKTYGIEKRKAQFWARDQIAKLNADMNRAQQKDAGVAEYVWSTSDDERVRDRHGELDGKTFSWSDPPVVDERTGRRGHPGEDYNCRCVALPKFNLSGLDLPWENTS